MAGQRYNSGKRSYHQVDSTMNENGRGKRRHSGDERDQYVPGPEDTVYRYLCQGRKIGSIIGRGGEIVKQLRAESQAKIRIGETVPGCDERMVTIFSSRNRNNETEAEEEEMNFLCPAQDALFRVHDRIVADETPGEEESDPENRIVTARMLVPADQIGCIIGKGGQIIQNMRSETGAQIRILKNDQLPSCAMNSDELLQISGDQSVVRKALYQVSSRLHDNPSRSQTMLFSSTNMYPAGGQFMGPNTPNPIMGIAPLLAPFGGYKGDGGGDWSLGSSNPFFPAPVVRDENSAREFGLRLVCPTGYIGGVIGKGGGIIKQIRQESGAIIKVESSTAEEDCIISVSAREFFEDPVSATIDAAVRLQPRCSEKIERESGELSYTTRLLVPTARIGCLIGKGGSIITEMRRLTRANIRIFSKENLPKVASEDDEMVQISGELDVARNALVQVAMRLKANCFEREGALPSFSSAVPYLPMAGGPPEPIKYGGMTDAKSYGRGYSYPSGGSYGGHSDLPRSETYESYAGSQAGNVGGYGSYGGYTSGRSGSSGISGQTPVSHGKHGY
ncbi:RNA-binding KH domain-containing protein RCF3-like isoform X1 [Nymphaea colorata]|nr:RNA-binding KH domain-containing protein RCF3-like isoform X1 [Nymphaea colorata]